MMAICGTCKVSGCGGDTVDYVCPECQAREIERLETALQEIAKGEGAFSRDPLVHASNTIEHLVAIAQEALKTKEKAAGVEGGKYQATFKFDERSLADLDVLVSEGRLSPELRQAFQQMREVPSPAKAEGAAETVMMDESDQEHNDSPPD